jgi:type VI secretion system protein ImpK
LQAELFGHQLAGEIVFQELQKLSGRSDSPELADVLEIFYLCLLLGFQGRYAASGGRGDLQAIMHSIKEKIRRIRGASTALSPRGTLPADAVRLAQADPLIRKLVIATVATVFGTMVLFVVLKLILISGTSGLPALAAS